MQTQDWVMLRVLVNRFHRGSAEAFSTSLPPEDIKTILSQDIHSQDVSAILINPFEDVTRIHYSWYPDALKLFAPPIDSYVIRSLPEPYVSGLCEMLSKNAPPRIPLSNAVKNYLLKEFYTKLKPSGLLPIPFLPPSVLNDILAFDKAEMVQIIDFLGLQDLAESVRFIVDKKKLKNIYQWLSPKKQQYLRLCLHNKNKLPITKLDLDRWDENYDELGSHLHRRGLIRFTKTLSGQHPDLIWYITHILDVGRGSIINKYFNKESIPGITPSLVQQLINLMNFIKQKSEM